MELKISGSKHGEFMVIFDLEDYDKIKTCQWYVNKFGNTETYGNYYIVNAKGRFMHRILMDAPKGMVVDHINHNTLDNRKENLRVCTFSENRKNNNTYKNNTSGYKGVLWYNYCKTPKWMAYIMVENKQITLGYFDNLEDAINIRNEAELNYFGDFANTPSK